MTGNRKYQYLVEGETEKKLITELKKKEAIFFQVRLTTSMLSNTG